MDVVQERLEREYNLNLIATAPSVIYHVHMTNGEIIKLDNPAKMPDMSKVDHLEEPFVRATIMTPPDYIGPLMELCQNKRGVFVNMDYLDANRNALI